MSEITGIYIFNKQNGFGTVEIKELEKYVDTLNSQLQQAEADVEELKKRLGTYCIKCNHYCVRYFDKCPSCGSKLVHSEKAEKALQAENEKLKADLEEKEQQFAFECAVVTQLQDKLERVKFCIKNILETYEPLNVDTQGILQELKALEGNNG